MSRHAFLREPAHLVAGGARDTPITETYRSYPLNDKAKIWFGLKTSDLDWAIVHHGERTKRQYKGAITAPSSMREAEFLLLGII